MEESLDTLYQRSIVETEREIAATEQASKRVVATGGQGTALSPFTTLSINAPAETPDTKPKSGAETPVSTPQIGGQEEAPLELPEVTITGSVPRYTVTDSRISDGKPTQFDRLEEAKQQAGTPEPLAHIEETLQDETFAQTLKTPEQKDAAKNFVELLNIPVEHLAGFLAKGDVTHAATPEELGDTILTPFSETLRGSLTEKQFSIMAMATGILAMAVVDPMNPLLMAGKVAKATATLAQPEFKSALNILKSERGSIPVGGKNPLIRKRFRTEDAPAGGPPSSLAERITRDINARTKVLTDEEGDRLAQSMIDSGEIDLESLQALLPGTVFKSPIEALAAHNLIKREQGLFADTATLAAETGDPALVEQAFAQLYGLANTGIPVASMNTGVAQMLRRASSPEMKAINLILERAAKTHEGQSKLEILRTILEDPRTDPAALGKTHTRSFRETISNANEIVTHGDEGQAELWLTEVKAAIDEEAQLSMFVTEKEIARAQGTFKNVTAQHIVEANQAGAKAAQAKQDAFKLTPTGPHQPKVKQSDYLKEEEANRLATIKEHQAQETRKAEGRSAFDRPRKAFALTPPAGSARRPPIPKQLDLLNAIAAESHPEQLAIEMADAIEVGNKEVSKQFLSLIKRGQEALASGDSEKINAILGKIQGAFKEKVPTGELQRPTRLVGLEKKAFDAFFSDPANKGLSPKDVLRVFVDSMPREREFLGLLKELKTPTGWDVWTDHFYNALLLGLAPVKNLVGTPSMMLSEVGQRAVMAGLDAGGVALARMLTGADLKRSVYMGEVGAMLNIKANLEAAQAGLMMGWHALRTGKPEFDISKLEHTIPDISNTALWLNTTGPMGQATSWMTTAQRRWTNKGIDMMSTIGGRLLLGGDTTNKFVAHQAQFRALALREAYNTVEREGLTGDVASERFLAVKRDVLAHPERYPELNDDATRFSQYVAFQQELGKAGESIRNLAASTTIGPPGRLGGLSGFPVGRWLAPFTSIQANVTRAAGELSGPFQLFSPAIHDELQTEGPRKLAAMAKIASSSVLLDVLYQNAGAELFTGNGPSDATANRQWRAATNKIPNAWWDPVSKEYRSCTAFEPFCTITSAVADLHDIMSATPPDRVDTLLPAMQALLITVVNNIGIKEYTQGLSGVINLSHTGSFDSYMDWFNHAVVHTVLPYSGMARQIMPAVDPAMRHATTLIDQLKNAIPTLSDSLAFERDGLGKVMFRTGGWWNAFAHGNESGDAEIWQALNDHNYVLGKPPQVLHGVRLNDLLYDEYLQAATDGLDEAIRQKIDSVGEVSDIIFTEQIDHIVQNHRRKGEAQFLRENPDIKESISDTRTRLRSGEQRSPSKFAPGTLSRDVLTAP